MRKLLTVCLCGFCPGRLVQFVFDGGFAAEAGVRAAAPLGCGGAWGGHASLLAAPAASRVRRCCVPGVPVVGGASACPQS